MSEETKLLQKQSAWSVLDNRVFRAIWIANVASSIGSFMHDTAAVWTMATLTSSPTLVTLMQAMSSLPMFLLALPAGALADMVDRRKVLMVAQSAALMVTALLAIFSWAGMLRPELLLGATFLLGTCVAFTMPTWQALLSEIVERKDLTGAITLGSIGVNIARSVGPMIAGVLLASSGPTAAFLLNAVSFLGIIVVLWRWKRPAPSPAVHRERIIGAVYAAVRFTRHSAVIRSVLMRNILFAFFGVAPVALLPLIVRGRGLAAGDFGAFMGAYGIGGVLAAFSILPWLRARFSFDQILAGATVVFSLMTMALSIVEHRLLMGAVLFVAGSAWLTSLSTLTVTSQSSFPNWVRARSSAIHIITIQASLALGAMAWGRVTVHSDPHLALQVAGAGLMTTLLLVRAFPVNPAMKLNLTPSSHWSEHELVLEPAQDDGPVMVTLEYEIREEDVDRFYAAMSRLRTTRLRDGAFRWSLYEDLGQPTHFREVFEVGSWGEHLRQHRRATADDKLIEDAVIAFHTGVAPPTVSHFLMKDVRRLGGRSAETRAYDPAGDI